MHSEQPVQQDLIFGTADITDTALSAMFESIMRLPRRQGESNKVLESFECSVSEEMKRTGRWYPTIEHPFLMEVGIYSTDQCAATLYLLEPKDNPVSAIDTFRPSSFNFTERGSERRVNNVIITCRPRVSTALLQRLIALPVWSKEHTTHSSKFFCFIAVQYTICGFTDQLTANDTFAASFLSNFTISNRSTYSPLKKETVS